MKIREANISDEKGIGKVHVDSWLSTYKGLIPDEKLNQLSYKKSEKKWKQNIENSLRSPEEILLVAEVDGEIIGFCNGGLNKDIKTQEYQSCLSAIYILKEFQRKGIGKNLISKFVEYIQKLNLNSMLIWVLEENQSRAFYEKMGGLVVAETDYEFSGKLLKAIGFGWKNLDKQKKIF